MTTCTGCLHERAGRCTMLPKQYAGDTQDGRDFWRWPPADERCGQFASAETQAAQAKALVEAMMAAMRAAAAEGGGSGA